jgi:ferredoxin-NADP reductase
MKHTIKLIKKENIAEGTMAFTFEKPQGFEYRAGQTVDMFLINPPETDAEGNMRTYSISSATYEGVIKIATRMRNTAFKRVLKTMPEGTAVEIDGPIGSFTLHQNEKKPAIILAGGIGITPFRSIILDATERVLPHEIYLFYSNRRPEDAVFLDDLFNAAKKNPHVHFVPTMTNIENSKVAWSGETGYITKEMINKYAKNVENAIYYLAGPQTMVKAMRTLLTAAGISEDDIRIEEFTGY